MRLAYTCWLTWRSSTMCCVAMPTTRNRLALAMPIFRHRDCVASQAMASAARIAKRTYAGSRYLGAPNGTRKEYRATTQSPVAAMSTADERRDVRQATTTPRAPSAANATHQRVSQGKLVLWHWPGRQYHGPLSTRTW